MEKKIIYLDHAATTATRPEVVDAMLPYFTENFWNPSSVYTPALNNRKVVDESRETIARSLGTTAENIYFTAGGSESDNWALKCTAEAYANKGKHIITSKIEHHAILHTCEYLEKKGFEITYIDVDENGILKLDDLKAAIRPDTILISVMFANNEIGTIQPIKEIGAIAKEHGILFHTDAVQAYAQIPINVDEYNIDMLSVSGHKFGGPKGIGFLYIRKGLKLRSFIHGGAQERKRRAGTENITGIVGIAKGKYPVEAVKMMNQIAISTEVHLSTKIKDYRSKYINRGISAAVAYSAVQTAHNVNAKCILASSMSGFTTRIVSKFKPDAQIIGLSPDDAIVRQMQIYWGVRPFKSHKAETTKDLLDEATDIVLDAGLAEKDDILVLTGGGPANHRGKGVTNMLKVVKIGEFGE